MQNEGLDEADLDAAQATKLRRKGKYEAQLRDLVA